jgi:hypothetical protein
MKSDTALKILGVFVFALFAFWLRSYAIQYTALHVFHWDIAIALAMMINITIGFVLLPATSLRKKDEKPEPGANLVGVFVSLLTIAAAWIYSW